VKLIESELTKVRVPKSRLINRRVLFWGWSLLPARRWGYTVNIYLVQVTVYNPTITTRKWDAISNGIDVQKEPFFKQKYLTLQRWKKIEKWRPHFASLSGIDVFGLQILSKSAAM